MHARRRLVVGIAGIGLVYWGLARLGSALYYPGGVQVVWLPAGFAAAILYLGDMRWAVGAAAADLILGAELFPFHLHALLQIVPLIVVWWRVSPPRQWWTALRPLVVSRRAIEAVVIIGAVGALSVAAFSSQHPLTYIVFPALVLAAVNLGQRGATAALALALAFAVAIVMTARNAGPFVTASINDEVLSTQLFMLVATVTTVTLGAAVSARRRAAGELAQSLRREADATTDERQRIAHDLHDSVSQTLFSLGLHAGIAKHELARTVLPQESAMPAAIYEVAGLAQSALLEMRASIFALRGAAVAEQGLVAALGAHASAVGVRHDVAVNVDGPEDRLPLDAEAEELLFKIGQEAITNAVKHSGSQAISPRSGIPPNVRQDR